MPGEDANCTVIVLPSGRGISIPMQNTNMLVHRAYEVECAHTEIQELEAKGLDVQSWTLDDDTFTVERLQQMTM